MIGIDPGPRDSAVAVIHRDSQGQLLIGASIYSNQSLLERISEHSGEPLAIEIMAPMGMIVGPDVFITCEWIGKFTHVHKGQQFRIYRSQVKSHICGSSRAKDKNIRAALIQRFGDPGTKNKPGQLYGISKDMWSALAIALTALENPPKIEKPGG